MNFTDDANEQQYSSFIFNSTTFLDEFNTQNSTTKMNTIANANANNQNNYPLEYCHTASIYVHNPIAIIGRLFQIVLSIITCCLFGQLLLTKKRASRAKVFHVNFTILFENLLVICLLYCFGALFLQLRYLVLYFTTNENESCSLLTPIWYTVISRIPGYLHLLALPLLHFAIMCERVRATMFSRIYEREGTTFSIMELAIIWLISLLFAVFIVSTSLSEMNLEMILIYASIVSKYNSALVIVLQYILLFLVILTVSFDFLVVWYNRQQKNKKFDTSIRYNLSQKYQINENALSMRLMLPLDLSFAAIFLLYLLISTTVRQMMANKAMDMTTFETIFDWLFCLNMQHGIISIWLYTRFIDEIRQKRAKKKNIIEVRPFSAIGEADAHFRQLKNQWA